MKLIVFQKKLSEVGSSDLVGGVSDLNNFFNFSSSIGLVFKDHHKFFEILFFLIDGEEILKVLERCVDIFFLFLEGRMDKEQLERASAEHTLSFSFELGQG